jgi:hypothetical protein
VHRAWTTLLLLRETYISCFVPSGVTTSTFRTYLPERINSDQVNAELSDGVLRVILPKSESAKPRRIEITS